MGKGKKAAPAAPGRVSHPGVKITDADFAYFIDQVRKGSPKNSACMAAGFTPSGLVSYLERNPHKQVELRRAFGRVRTEGENSLYKIATGPVGEKGPNMAQVRALEFLLTNVAPDEWKSKPEGVGEGTELDIAGRQKQLSAEEIDKLRRKAKAKILGAGAPSPSDGQVDEGGEGPPPGTTTH